MEEEADEREVPTLSPEKKNLGRRDKVGGSISSLKLPLGWESLVGTKQENNQPDQGTSICVREVTTLP